MFLVVGLDGALSTEMDSASINNKVKQVKLILCNWNNKKLNIVHILLCKELDKHSLIDSNTTANIIKYKLKIVYNTWDVENPSYLNLLSISKLKTAL